MSSQNKGRKISICVIIVVAYIIIDMLIFMYSNAIVPIQRYMIGDIVKRYIMALVLMVIIVALPYEKIIGLWKNHRIYPKANPADNNRNMIIEAVIIYVITLVVMCFVTRIIYGEFYTGRSDRFLIMTFALIFIMVFSFELIHSNIMLIIIDFVLAMANGIVMYIIQDLFYFSVFMLLGIFVAWNICNLISDRKHKVLNMTISLVISISTFFAAVYITGKERALSAWLNPTLKENLSISWEYNILREQHSFNMPDEITWTYQYYHPFLSIYKYLGGGALALFIMAFIAVTIAVIASVKLLSKKRYMVMVSLYSLGAVSFLYMMLADLGFVPTAYVNFIPMRLYIPIIGLIIRLFIVKETQSDEQIHIRQPE